jgi:hypothetical protein
MSRKLFVRAKENGEIITYGEELTNATEIKEIPADWSYFQTMKYVFDGTALVVRAGWVDPVISDEPEVPAEPEPEPETPADPE